jgi:hypothetical protein
MIQKREDRRPLHRQGDITGADATTGIGEWGLDSSPRFEVFTAVTMKNVVFWNIKTQFVLHRRHIRSPLQSPAS